MSSAAAGTSSVDTRARRALVVAGIALFVDMLVYGLAVPVLPLLPAVVKAGPAATGILFAGYAIAVILVTPLVGRMVDRRGPRRPLLVGLGGLCRRAGAGAAGFRRANQLVRLPVSADERGRGCGGNSAGVAAPVAGPGEVRIAGPRR
jgi:MFS family permease